MHESHPDGDHSHSRENVNEEPAMCKKVTSSDYLGGKFENSPDKGDTGKFQCVNAFFSLCELLAIFLPRIFV